MNEVWKPIEGYEGLYEVSNFGRIKSLEREGLNKNGHMYFRNEFIRKTTPDGKGYKQLSLTIGGKSYNKRVCRLVASAFVPNPEGKPTVNHINGIKDDDTYTNLEWNTYSENVLHAFKTKLSVNHKGEDHHNAVLTNDEVRELRRLYEIGNLDQRDLAKMFGVSQPTIGRMLRHETYKYI